MTSLYDSITSMERSGHISKATAAAFSKSDDRTLPMPLGLDKARHDPEFVCVLIDESGSMAQSRQAVIDTHPHLLDPLRKSAKCRHNALFVAQYLFSKKASPLQPMTRLSADGNDDVVRLTTENYMPNGKTALYMTVFQMLQDCLMIADHCAREQGLEPKIYIMLVTDGDDTEGTVDPGDVRRCLDEMRAKNRLGVAAVLGLISESLSEKQLEAIRATLGFDTVIPCARTNDKELRRAMGQMSASIAEGMRA